MTRQAGRRTAPWANGRGVTSEVAAESDESGLVWRLSMADLDGDMAFSQLRGLDRVFTVIGDHPVNLFFPLGEEQDDRCVHARQHQPIRFSGESAPRCVASAPTTALNLMVRRGTCSPEVKVTRIEQNSILVRPDGAVTIVFILSGSAQISGQNLAAGDCLVLEAGRVTLETRGAVAITMSFTPLHPAR